MAEEMGRGVTNAAHLARTLLRARCSVLTINEAGVLLVGYQGRNYLLMLPEAEPLDIVELWRGTIVKVRSPEQALIAVGAL